MAVEFRRSSLRQSNVINVSIAYELNIWSRDLNIKFKLDDWLVWAVKLTKKTDPEKYR